MNAIELLVHDHETVKKLLNELSETTERALKKRSELLGRLELELVLHTAIEEDIFYPAIRESGGKEELKMYYEAKEEHRTVDSLVLPDLKRTRPDTVQFAGRVKVLKELLEHHIEEEEGELFPRARQLLDAAALKQLGQAMQQHKKELKARLENGRPEACAKKTAPCSRNSCWHVAPVARKTRSGPSASGNSRAVATRSAAMPPATWSRASARRTCRASRRGGPRCGCSRTSTRSP